jgi:hypothetical protein
MTGGLRIGTNGRLPLLNRDIFRFGALPEETVIVLIT